MATTWSPRTNSHPESWLLTNGEVVQEPALEETPSGRKVRVAGTTLSAWASDVDTLVKDAVRQVATSKQTKIWMPLGQLNKPPGSSLPAKLHILHEDVDQTAVWWRFKHPTLPIEATLTINANDRRRYYNEQGPTQQELVGRLELPPTHTGEATRFTLTQHNANWDTVRAQLGYDSANRLTEFIRDNEPAWGRDMFAILGPKNLPTEHALAKELLKRVRLANALPTIQIPDLRDEQNPAWLDLELYDTNCTDAFIGDLTDYLDGQPAVEKAVELYREMRKTLRQLGMVLDEKEPNEFMAALLAGNAEALKVQVFSPIEEGGARDENHELHMHLLSGTFVVECGLHTVSKDEVADRWQEAQVIAQLTGKEDELLAYAREYGRTAAERRTKKILAERMEDE